MKSAFITGASQGLGYGFVQNLLDDGWRVFAGTRAISPQLPVAENLSWIKIELTEDASIDAAVAAIREHTDAIDLLVNNAGINKDTATNNHKEKATVLRKLDRSVLRTMFDVNAIAPMIVVQKFLPFLTTDPSFVINVSSCRASFHDHEGNTNGNYGYRASKIALNMLTACSLYDLPKNVRTFAVHPGNVHSAMNPAGETTPQEQAAKILGIMESWNEELNGAFLNYDGTPYPL